jgi:hypothetical protein
MYKLKNQYGNILISNPDVVRWVYGDLGFLAKKTMAEETLWGKSICKQYGIEIKSHIWTGTFGEHLVYNALYAMDKFPVDINAKNGYTPDFLTKDRVVEVKTSSFSSSNSNIYNVLATPFKYAEIPKDFGRPLDIVCVGFVEHVARHKYGLLSGQVYIDSNRNKIVEYYKTLGINYVGFSQMLEKLV